MKNNKDKIRVNQLRIGVVLSYITTFVQMIIQLVYTPVMLRLVGQSEYGLYTLVGSVVSYLSLFSLGFTGAYLRFYSRTVKLNDDKEVARLNGMFLAVFLLMSLLATVSGMVLSQFTPQVFGSKLSVKELAKATILMRILVINIAMTFPSSILNSIISAHEQFLFQRIVTLTSAICNPLISLPLLIMGLGSIAMVCVTTGITFVGLIVNACYCVKVLRIRFIFDGFKYSVIRNISSFSFFIFLNMIIDQANWSIDKFILGRVAGTTAVAIYGVGSTIHAIYSRFSTSISSVFAPRVNKIASSDEDDLNEQFTQLFIKVGRIQFIVLGLIASGLVFFGKYFITHIYAGPEYYDSYGVVLLLILPLTIPLIQNIGIEVQRSVNKHKARTVMYLIMAIINVLISIPLSVKYGPTGAALGTAISLILANGLFMNIYYYKVIKIDIIDFWNNILKMSPGLIIPVLLGIIINFLGEIRSSGAFVFYIIAYSSVYVISMYFFGMNQYEKSLINEACRRIKNNKPV